MTKDRFLLAIVALALACGPSADQQLEKARGALAAGKHGDAVAAAKAGLDAGAQGATAWRLELVALEGEARGRQTDAALARLDRRAQAHPDQVKGPLYAQTASQVNDAGDGAGSVRVLNAGAQRFPQDADIAKAIEQAKASGGADQLKELKTLGYVQ
jgi:hypothetical protein